MVMCYNHEPLLNFKPTARHTAEPSAAFAHLFTHRCILMPSVLLKQCDGCDAAVVFLGILAGWRVESLFLFQPELLLKNIFCFPKGCPLNVAFSLITLSGNMTTDCEPLHHP